MGFFKFSNKQQTGLFNVRVFGTDDNRTIRKHNYDGVDYSENVYETKSFKIFSFSIKSINMSNDYICFKIVIRDKRDDNDLYVKKMYSDENVLPNGEVTRLETYSVCEDRYHLFGLLYKDLRNDEKFFPELEQLVLR